MELSSVSVVRVPGGRSRVAGVAALASIALALFDFGREMFAREPSFGGTALLGLLAIVLSGLYASVRGGASTGVVRVGAPSSLRVRDGALFVGDERVAAKVVGGFVEMHGSHEQLVVQLGDGGLVVAKIDDRRRAEELLDELGVAPDRRALVIELGRPHTAGERALLGGAVVFFATLSALVTVLALLGALVLLFGSGDVFFLIATTVGAILATLLLVVALRALARTSVRVGADGIFVKNLVRTRFLPYRAMGPVLVGQDVVRFPEHELEVRTAGAIEARVVADRIEAMRLRSSGAASDLAVLARAGRSTAEWREALEAIADDGYRAACSPEELVRLVEDAAAAPELRVAAAIALGKQEDAKQRVHAAIEAVAEPKLRIALERAADGEIDEEALAEAQRVAGA